MILEMPRPSEAIWGLLTLNVSQEPQGGAQEHQRSSGGHVLITKPGYAVSFWSAW